MSREVDREYGMAQRVTPRTGARAILLASIAVVAVASATVIARSWNDDSKISDSRLPTQEDARTVLGTMPEDIAREFRESIERDLQSMAELGYIPFTDDEADFYRIESLERVVKEEGNRSFRASFAPASLRLSHDSIRLRFVGSYTDAEITEPDQPVYEVTQVFAVNDDITASLREIDYIHAGATMTLFDAGVNTRVGERPAALTLHRAPNGMSVILVQWITAARAFSLYVAGPSVGMKDKDIALMIANAVSE
jgi:hypothetical protein